MAQPDRRNVEVGVDANLVYALGSSQDETERLRRQAEELAAISASVLDRVGLGPGQRALDLGCGPRGVVDEMAVRVAPGGTVVGVDADPVHVAAAWDFVADRRIGGVEVVVADARATGLPAASFDVAHCRTLLVTIPRPRDVVAEMVRLVRPGGWVVAVEPDVEYSMCHPPSAAFDRICELFVAAFSRNGADPMLGRKVPALFRHAGLDDVWVDVRPQLFPPGHTRRTNRLDLVHSLRQRIVEMGLASEADLGELDREARDHLDDPDTVTIAGLLFLVGGRRVEVGSAGRARRGRR
jgi:ubiquinone/menaquinone biosynthesis C-methylase UbiE